MQKINFEGKKATGVSFFQKEKVITVKANREVILSAGSIGSPHILQVSGVGDSEKLKKHGIETVHELKGVGKNLQDHLMFRPVYKVKNLKSLNSKINSSSSNSNNNNGNNVRNTTKRNRISATCPICRVPVYGYGERAVVLDESEFMVCISSTSTTTGKSRRRIW